MPLNAPLPTAWNLPFQPDAGSHTSILMSESARRLQRRGDAAERGQRARGPAATSRARRRERSGLDRLGAR